MSKVVGYSLVSKAKRGIFYRYTCGACGRLSADYNNEIEETMTQEKRGSGRINFDMGEYAALEEKVDSMLANKVAEIEKSIATKDYSACTDLFRESEICPHCGSKQPWASPVMVSTGGWVLLFSLFGILVGFALKTVLELPSTGIAGLISVLIPIGGGVTVGALFGSVRKKKKISEYKAAIAATKVRTLVEIAWGPVERI